MAEYGIKCMVIHGADVPATQYENVMKSDPVDSGKLAKALKVGTLPGIYIRRKENLVDRSVVRLRKTLQNQLIGYKSPVKHLFYTNGIKIPECFSKPGTQWSKHFVGWLGEKIK